MSSAAQRQRRYRERQRDNLLECAAWIPGEVFEAARDSGLLTEADALDKESRGRWLALAFEQWVQENSH